MTILAVATGWHLKEADELRRVLPGDEVLWLSPSGPYEAAAPAEAIVAGLNADRAKALLAAAPRVRWFHTLSAGVERLLIPEITERQGLVLTNNSGAYDVPIAEHVMAFVFAAAKRFPDYQRAQAEHRWERERQHQELRDSTMVVFGMGSIGGEVARLSSAAGMRVIGVRRDHRAPAAPATRVVGPDALADVAAEADWLVVAAPLTAATRGAISAEVIARLKPTAWVVNIARGSLIDQAALLAALRAGRIGGAALDVFDPEPLPGDHELWSLPNVIITPHASSSSPRVRERSIALIAENMRRFKKGEPLLNRVDYARGY